MSTSACLHGGELVSRWDGKHCPSCDALIYAAKVCIGPLPEPPAPEPGPTRDEEANQ
ncbi:hypothetical protein [Streptomyces marincola]|uniref:hypothetical protein n=1 Tax=Streptomyces marincola TaxID=2878388 RepID=UPI001CF34588|nr:hypothetical protein [Streptomyces marincola]UCM88099.1 hypothetical protein LC193_09105 [Streptomyces marincola]